MLRNNRTPPVRHCIKYIKVIYTCFGIHKPKLVQELIYKLQKRSPSGQVHQSPMTIKHRAYMQANLEKYCWCNEWFLLPIAIVKSFPVILNLIIISPAVVVIYTVIPVAGHISSEDNQSDKFFPKKWVRTIIYQSPTQRNMKKSSSDT